MLASTFLVGFLLSLATPNSGWTDLSPSPDTRTVYVSSSTGNDANNGLSEAFPKATISAGIALLRHSHPDHLLLKKGDSWASGLGQWKKSGRSANERMVIASYGSGSLRPRLLTGPLNGVFTNGGGGSPATIDHIAIVGIHFEARTYGGVSEPYGVYWLQPSVNFLIEDCLFEKYHKNLAVQGFGGIHTNFALRRSAIVDAYSNHPSYFSQGLYLAETHGALIEENLFDRNGSHPTIPGAHETVYNHSMYIDNGNQGVIVRGNIVANADGLQLRPGGICEDNLFARTSIALLLGGGNHPDNGTAGVHVEARRNVILDGKNIDAANPRGWGINVMGIASGTIAQNIVANNSLGTYPVPLEINGTVFGNNADGCCVRNLRIERNLISNWGGSIRITGTPQQIANVSFRGNEVRNEISGSYLVDHFNPANNAAPAPIASSNNRFFSLQAPLSAWMYAGGNQSIQGWKSLMGDHGSVAQAVDYPNPTVSIAEYHARLGETPTHEAFLIEARKQSRDFWRPEYTARTVNTYIRQSFGR